MTSALFFESLRTQWEAGLPFVAYRKPHETRVNALFQKSDKLIYTQDFTESGFVFSPYNQEEKTILIPLEGSDRCSMSEPEITKSDLDINGLDNNQNLASKGRHTDLVAKGVNEIEQSNLQKVVLSRSEAIELTNPDPLSIFKKLLQRYSRAFVYLWYHPKIGLWLGATPETLIRVENRRLSVMALAGTQVYQGTVDVEWKTKERQEQQYVTDFIVSNLKTSAENIRVSEVETTRSGNLLHLKSTISGTLKSTARDMRQLLRTLHPTPAVCGVPKNEAMAFIKANENYDREFYTGFLGELNFEKKRHPRSSVRNIEHRAYKTQTHYTQLYVNLRCMQLKENLAILYVGGGITSLSDPASEWDETVSKSNVIKSVL
ncbi:chorismate-binding protein [Aestuariivivens sediminicola]|uniref:chorismate-binding protein n=1 Tax=Aestuariivivens sediminicola TaxID=2913560 RepID=UPI001F593853|nr:chorismate-binding protein [Aestuariivivens sediminicola]